MEASNVVKEFCIGNAKIKIADNFCKPQSEVEQILKNIAAQVQWQLMSGSSKGCKGKQKVR